MPNDSKLASLSSVSDNAKSDGQSNVQTAETPKINEGV